MDSHAADCKGNLKKIAETLARQEHSEYVLERHVDAAFDALAKLGLTRAAFWKRSELEISAGSFLVGIALSMPDILPTFLPARFLEKQGITAGSSIFTFLVGVLIAAHGWYRANTGK